MENGCLKNGGDADFRCDGGICIFRRSGLCCRILQGLFAAQLSCSGGGAVCKLSVSHKLRTACCAFTCDKAARDVFFFNAYSAFCSAVSLVQAFVHCVCSIRRCELRSLQCELYRFAQSVWSVQYICHGRCDFAFFKIQCRERIRNICRAFCCGMPYLCFNCGRFICDLRQALRRIRTVCRETDRAEAEAAECYTSGKDAFRI